MLVLELSELHKQIYFLSIFVKQMHAMKKLYSIFRLQCPHCHRGEFLEKRPRPFWSWVRVRDSCPHCERPFKIEPSFYYGSMYVAYAIGVALMGLVTMIYFLSSKNFSVSRLFLLIVGVLVVLNPYINAYSKSIWANFFFAYNPALGGAKKSE